MSWNKAWILTVAFLYLLLYLGFWLASVGTIILFSAIAYQATGKVWIGLIAAFWFFVVTQVASRYLSEWGQRLLKQQVEKLAK